MINKNKFLNGEFWILSWNGSVQRALKYKKECTENQRRAFRQYMIDYCEQLILPAYRSPVSDEQHLENIVCLCDAALNHIDPSVLAEPYNIGVAQKLLNLQLKYLWCASYITMPPHCPIDRIVLGYTCLKNKVKWTTISSIAEYKSIIDVVRDTAGDQPIAVWELNSYNDARFLSAEQQRQVLYGQSRK